MALLHPFRALRPKPDAAASIAAVPYDVVSTDEARAMAEGNLRSFLRVSRAELELPDGTDPSQVLEMLRNLSPEHRLVLILKYVDELSTQEIASMLDRSLAATKSLLSRARRALAGSLTENPS